MYRLRFMEKTTGVTGEGYECIGVFPTFLSEQGQKKVCKLPSYRSGKTGISLQLKARESFRNNCDQYILTVRNTSTEKFKGVIAIQVEWSQPTPDAWENTKFFMPAYLYDRNRGDQPLYLSYEERKGLYDLPKIGTGLHPMTAQKHMVRGDRLSHPVSGLYLNGNLLAVSVPPTLVRENDALRGETASVREDVFQYNGFFCVHAQSGNGVGFTLGYENAPHLYVCSTTPVKDCAWEQTALTLEPGQSVTTDFQAGLVLLRRFGHIDLQSAYPPDVLHCAGRDRLSICPDEGFLLLPAPGGYLPVGAADL